MCQHAPRYTAFLLFLVLLAAGVASACDRTADTATSPSAPGLQASITAEPLAAKPEFLNGPFCNGRSAFGVRVFIRLLGRNLLLRGLRFQFVDLFGNRILPEVITLPSASASASSLPFPSSSPIALPGIAALPPLPPTEPMGFFARFGCGIVPQGTLIITGDHDGGSSQVRVIIAER